MNNINEDYDFLTVTEMCELLGIGRSTAYKIIKNTPGFKACKLGYGWKIQRSALQDYLEQLLSATKK